MRIKPRRKTLSHSEIENFLTEVSIDNSSSNLADSILKKDAPINIQGNIPPSQEEINEILQQKVRDYVKVKHAITTSCSIHFLLL